MFLVSVLPNLLGRPQQNAPPIEINSEKCLSMFSLPGMHRVCVSACVTVFLTGGSADFLVSLWLVCRLLHIKISWVQLGAALLSVDEWVSHYQTLLGGLTLICWFCGKIHENKWNQLHMLPHVSINPALLSKTWVFWVHLLPLLAFFESQSNCIITRAGAIQGSPLVRPHTMRDAISGQTLPPTVPSSQLQQGIPKW